MQRAMRWCVPRVLVAWVAVLAGTPKGTQPVAGGWVGFALAPAVDMVTESGHDQNADRQYQYPVAVAVSGQ
jgi:hypothetical protein